ncbi:hypothetical protein NQ314_010679 [Rhamnusium bicolor]|uniref:G-protein coupled receptors family 2 profile 2 domain-containing protein n=1 Tax=Rhamnusium bicolor TaxID=1586634 RepID=A0AAV8XNQ5_9CUCU|nr:hypothetical protein NQ314_010679 [Rhamnusium bicolor]
MIINKERLLIIFIIRSSVCNSLNDDAIDLCSNNVVEYNHYNTVISDDCGCHDLCVKKCCRKGFYYYHNGNADNGQLISGCLKNDSMNFSVPIFDTVKKVTYVYDNFSVGLLNCVHQQVVEFNLDNSDTKPYFYIQQNGSLYYSYDKTIDSDTDYCADHQNGITTYYFCKDLDDPFLWIHVAVFLFLYLFLAKAIPIPFLLATFFVYAFLPERNIHKNALTFHIGCLILGNILLGVNQYYIIENDIICILSGYLTLYVLSASFFWMNVMCIDIWLAFSGLRGFSRQLQKENVIFIILSIYAWGSPGLILLVVGLLEIFSDPGTYYYPGIGRETCFLKGRKWLNSGLWIPEIETMLVILIVFNVILFILTSINVQKTRREAAILAQRGSARHTSTDDEKFTLYWNLLFIMGINPIINSHLVQFTARLVGWTTSPNISIYFTYHKDFAHAMYGIVIFIIFVCKRKIWKTIKDR